jgi:hypothetical protein
MREIYRIECSKFSDLVELENGIITDTMPVFRKFVGQPVGNLTNWLHKVFGAITIKRVE